MTRALMRHPLSEHCLLTPQRIVLILIQAQLCRQCSTLYISKTWCCTHSFLTATEGANRRRLMVAGNFRSKLVAVNRCSRSVCHQYRAVTNVRLACCNPQYICCISILLYLWGGSRIAYSTVGITTLKKQSESRSLSTCIVLMGK